MFIPDIERETIYVPPADIPDEIAQLIGQWVWTSSNESAPTENGGSLTVSVRPALVDADTGEVIRDSRFLVVVDEHGPQCGAYEAWSFTAADGRIKTLRVQARTGDPRPACAQPNAEILEVASCISNGGCGYQVGGDKLTIVTGQTNVDFVRK